MRHSHLPCPDPLLPHCPSCPYKPAHCPPPFRLPSTPVHMGVNVLGCIVADDSAQRLYSHAAERKKSVGGGAGGGGGMIRQCSMVYCLLSGFRPLSGFRLTFMSRPRAATSVATRTCCAPPRNASSTCMRVYCRRGGGGTWRTEGGDGSCGVLLPPLPRPPHLVHVSVDAPNLESLLRQRRHQGLHLGTL